MIYINPYLSIPINTIIGGVAASIPNKSALATKLAISESIIKRFEIVGSDVRSHITSSYIVPLNAFEGNSNISFYDDFSGKVNELGAYAFKNSTINRANFPKLIIANLECLFNTQLVEAVYPYATYFYRAVGNCANLKKIEILSYEEFPLADTRGDAFGNLTSCEMIDMRKLKVYGASSTGFGSTTSGFINLKLGCEIRVHIALKTADSGNPHRALTWVKANRAAIVNFYDDAGNYVSTL